MIPAAAHRHDQLGVAGLGVGMLQVAEIPVDDGHGPHGATGPRLASRRAAFSAFRRWRIFRRSGTPRTIAEHDAGHQAGEHHPDETGLVREEPEVHGHELRVLDDEGDHEDDQGQDRDAPDGPPPAAAQDVVHLFVLGQRTRHLGHDAPPPAPARDREARRRYTAMCDSSHSLIPPRMPALLSTSDDVGAEVAVDLLGVPAPDVAVVEERQGPQAWRRPCAPSCSNADCRCPSGRRRRSVRCRCRPSGRDGARTRGAAGAGRRRRRRSPHRCRG